MLFCLTNNLKHAIIYTDHRETSNKKEKQNERTENNNLY